MVSTYDQIGDEAVLTVFINIESAKTGRQIPIGMLEISNIGGDDNYANYEVALHEDHATGHTTRGCKLNFRRARGALALVQEALAELLRKRA